MRERERETKRERERERERERKERRGHTNARGTPTFVSRTGDRVIACSPPANEIGRAVGHKCEHELKPCNETLT
jgi:hypothetical protein